MYKPYGPKRVWKHTLRATTTEHNCSNESNVQWEPIKQTKFSSERSFHYKNIKGIIPRQKTIGWQIEKLNW